MSLLLAAVVTALILAIVGAGIIYYSQMSGPVVSDKYRKYAESNPVCDLPNCDVLSNGAKVNNAHECQLLCDSNPRCQGFLHMTKGSFNGTNCWIKQFKNNPPKTTHWADADFYGLKAAEA